MRIDPVHHKLAVFQGDGPGLCHVNFQVDTIDDVFRNWHFLVDHAVEIEMGPGRHPQSTAIFLYFLGPEGFTFEYSFGVRRIADEAAWVPRTFDPDEPGSIDMWLGPVRRVSTQPQLHAVDAVGPTPGSRLRVARMGSPIARCRSCSDRGSATRTVTTSSQLAGRSAGAVGRSAAGGRRSISARAWGTATGS